ncbi:hypothetical protein VNO77_30344 [Canavalia gladiata]|uniref:Uncharacterized protein n=1 Tax=Canavalia gladiata TaxID=3824 RepID=A0AAN9KQR6_CANGL
MVAVGSADTSYLRMGSLNGHLPTPSGPQHFCNNVLRSYPLDGITMPLSETLRQGTIPPTDNLSFANLQGGNLSAASSITSLSSQSHDLLTDMHSQGVIFTNNPGQISNNVPFQGWDYHNQSGSYHSHVIGNSLISVNGDVDPEGYASMNSTFNRNLELSFCDPLQMKHDGGMRLNEQTSSKLQEGYIMNQHKSHNSCVTNKNLGSLEDLVNAMINRYQGDDRHKSGCSIGPSNYLRTRQKYEKVKQDKVKISDGSLGDNNYSGGASM